MADVNADELIRMGEHLFSKKFQILSLWQTLAEEMYQARADFTVTKVAGDEFMEEQYTSVPAIYRRDLASAFGALTRPKSQQWFDYKSRDETRNTDAAKAWFSQARDKQRTLLYTERANFQDAMQGSDDDFVTFGNAVISMQEDEERGKTVVYNLHHLRDCAWSENSSRRVTIIFRKFKLQLGNWEQQFKGKTLPDQYTELRKRDPHHEIELWHCSLPLGYYDFYKKRAFNPKHKFASVYIDPSLRQVIKEGANFEFPYIVRRWKLLDNSAYAHSPAAMYGLIDARLLQAQTRVVMEAAERVIDPVLIARKDGVLGRINNYPGSTVWIDPAYDEKNGEAIRPLQTGSNVNLGLEMIQDTRQMLAACNYLNKLNLPPDGPQMTATEVQERISEYIRSVGPAIEPFQDDNARLLATSFAFNLRLGNFGPPESIPRELDKAQLAIEFEGPLQQAYKKIKLSNADSIIVWTGKLVQATGDPHHPALKNFNYDQITRDVAGFNNAEPGWVFPKEEVQAQLAAEAQAAQQAQAPEKVGQALQGAHSVADLIPKLAEANQVMPAITGGGGAPSSSLYPTEEEQAA